MGAVVPVGGEPIFKTRFYIAAAFFGLAATGCASLAGERGGSGLDMSLQQVSQERPAVRFWFSEAALAGADGMQNAGVVAIAAELVDRVNRDYVNRLRTWADPAIAFELEVPPPMLFGSPITLPPSAVLNSGVIRSAVYASFPPMGEWTLAVRHRIEYNVFSDSVELQLASVVTLLQPNGMPYWQTSLRSRKFYDAWATSDQLAALSAKFASQAVVENVKQLREAPRFSR